MEQISGKVRHFQSTRRWPRHQVDLSVRIIALNGILTTPVPARGSEISRAGMALHATVASNVLTAFRTNCNANRARNPYAPCPLVWIGLRKIGHHWRICHLSPEPPRLPKG